MPLPTLYISHLNDLDRLSALQFGTVDDDQPDENWLPVHQNFAYLLDQPGGRVLGFVVPNFSEFEPDMPCVEEIWDGPRFDAPTLGLTGASAGEVVTAAIAEFEDGRPSVNCFFFNMALHEQGEGNTEGALVAWLGCLRSGDLMGHYGLGYTYFELGEFHKAYSHLRFYSALVPSGAWASLWYGKAAEAIGELDEARTAFEKALEFSDENEGPDEDEVASWLRRLDVAR